jgi:glyoxylase-like metal-dependent hydrolase (beta-lactamase superfamily II)
LKAPILEALGDGAYAYPQTGGWGFSNAGLITSGGASLLVDTLYDLRLTQEMLTTMRRATDASQIDAVVNTHANGDHCPLGAHVAPMSHTHRDQPLRVAPLG